ncbi:deoxyribose-phosphate aldolase [Calorimonas adulescens]|uniref:Deoxyribose-phosphate aldolase n=1 Tax=Calorimonas adulescens TaxID=2606906 RepID=A0A5D8Q904_9THEO|nr:deoxyribose-phosphate aldolase [Calorimonas adulescens]TZE81255.1 deoxyribose-phosphate aldolase [Calorimonas adulescens]
MIDHTLLKPEASEADIKKLCDEAIGYRFHSVCVNPSYVGLARQCLENSGVKVCTVIGFPLGATTTRAKVSEAIDAVENGATELDMVLNIGMLKSKNYDRVLNDIKSVVGESKKLKEGILVKVILETCLLAKDEKVKACELALEAGADFVKTSTGFSTGGATVEDIKLMRNTVGPNVGVKASGGIRDLKTAIEMIEAGATRIGASSSVKIINEL